MTLQQKMSLLWKITRSFISEMLVFDLFDELSNGHVHQLVDQVVSEIRRSDNQQQGNDRGYVL